MRLNHGSHLRPSGEFSECSDMAVRTVSTSTNTESRCSVRDVGVVPGQQFATVTRRSITSIGRKVSAAATLAAQKAEKQ